MTMDNSNKLGPDQIQLSKCEICDKEFQTNNSLMNHFKSIHNLEKEYQCNICQKIFNIQRQVTSHVKIVHENKKHHKIRN